MKFLEKNKVIIVGVLLVVAIGAFTFKTIFSKCTVVFDAQGGSDIAAVEVEKGSKVTKPDDPLRVGYTFQGWYLNDEEYDFDSAVEEDITLVAKWESVADNS